MRNLFWRLLGWRFYSWDCGSDDRAEVWLSGNVELDPEFVYARPSRDRFWKLLKFKKPLPDRIRFRMYYRYVNSRPET